MSKPITLWSHEKGPNPWKVTIILEELNIPYKMEFLEPTSKTKEEPYISLNPNGRVPAIEDPNTGITLWESGAIILYLVDTYDKDNKLSYGDKSPEKHLLRQWLMFQMSGQGPYTGQFAWFSRFHHEKLPSAIERYEKETRRICSVIDLHLSRTGQDWLVGDKCTYADLCFLGWGQLMPLMLGETWEKIKEESPKYVKWHEAMMKREAVDRVLKERQKYLK